MKGIEMKQDEKEPKRLRTTSDLVKARGDTQLSIENFSSYEEYRQLRPKSAADDD